MKNFTVFLFTSNALMHYVPVWAYLFNQFWPWKQKVKVIGYDEPSFTLPDNFEYIALGHQRGPKYWSDDIRGPLEEDDSDLVYMTFEDGFIIKPIDKQILDLAFSMARNTNDTLFSKFCLTADVQYRAFDVVESFNGYDLIIAKQNTSYRQSLSHGIWRKKVFLDKLKNQQSPWDFELDNRSSVNDGYSVYGTLKKYALHWGHGCIKGKKSPNWYRNVHHNNNLSNYYEYDKYAMLDERHVNYIRNNISNEL